MELWQMRVKNAAISQRMTAALNYLKGDGENPFYVGLVLDTFGVTGCGQKTCCCPVARFLQQCEPYGIVHVFDDHYRVHTEWGSLVVGPLPWAVREFVRIFDEGNLPHLVDYDHRHGLLNAAQT